MPNGGFLTIETGDIDLDDEYAAAHAEVTPGEYVVLAVSDTGTGTPREVVTGAVGPFCTTKGLALASALSTGSSSSHWVTSRSTVRSATARWRGSICPTAAGQRIGPCWLI
jgi:phosphoglycerate-specific signal transduction histidine kinase